MTTELIERLRRIAKRASCNSPDSVTEAADELERLADLVEKIADAFCIGSETRTPTVILENVRNAARRSACLSRIEAHHTIAVEDEDGEPMEEQLLSWGEEPDQYIETYRAILTPNARLTGATPAGGASELKR